MANIKNSPKINWKIREIDGSFLCLQRFDKFWIWSQVYGMTGNGSYFNIAETCMKKFVKSLQVNLFLAGFSNLKLMCFVVHAVLQLACRLTELRSACMHSVTELITYLTTNPVWLSFFNFFAQISHQIVKITVDSHQELFDLTIFSFLFRVS